MPEKTIDPEEFDGAKERAEEQALRYAEKRKQTQARAEAMYSDFKLFILSNVIIIYHTFFYRNFLYLLSFDTF